MKRAEIRVFGDVQGVFYRSFVETRARMNNIVGWVKNESDGSVSIVAEGEDADAERFVKAIQVRDGTRHVERTQVIWSEASGAFSDFKRLH
ncbi:Acylphosphatase [Candidatus Norongarragalina meridionalis]|nr:Acylphosphatase [Candidatus Norongarragalina meridionalis]